MARVKLREGIGRRTCRVAEGAGLKITNPWPAVLLHTHLNMAHRHLIQIHLCGLVQQPSTVETTGRETLVRLADASFKDLQ